jgi:hypothetical protein
MRVGKALKAMLLFKLLKRSRLFPLIPLAPAALVIGALVTAFRALGRVKHLEQRLGENPI